jgi:hypothetical protein
MKKIRLTLSRTIITALFIIALLNTVKSQTFDEELKLKPVKNDDFGLNLSQNQSLADGKSLLQKPSKKIYFVPGGKIGCFFWRAIIRSPNDSA